MASALPSIFKQYGPTLERAKELDTNVDDPDASIIALYCRKHVLEQAAKNLPAKGSEGYDAAMTFFLHLMDEVEAKKSTVQLSPEQAHSLCHSFANISFAKAVKAEETEVATHGRTSKETAMLYYRANVFLSILAQFEGGFDEEVRGRKQHAALKAAQLMKQVSGAAAGPASNKAPAASATAAMVLPPGPGMAGGVIQSESMSTSPASAMALKVPSRTSSANSTGLDAAFPEPSAPAAPAVSTSFGISSIFSSSSSSSFSSAPAHTTTPGASDGNYTLLGFAESKSLLEACCGHILDNSLERAQESLDAAIHLRSLNTKARDAIELCHFAVSAKKRADEVRTIKFVSDARKRLQG